MNKKRIFTSLVNLPKYERVVILGNFDGLHKGHQALLKRGIRTAKKNNLITSVFTFHPQIQSYLNKEFKYLLSNEDKLKRIFNLGIDEIISLPFDQNIMHCTPIDFMQKILKEQLYAKYIVSGYNFSFGYKGEGQAKDLKAVFGETHTDIIEPVTCNAHIISSTLIKDNLTLGNLELANDMLGYPFTLSGIVTHGNKNGRKFGFPTANLALPENIILPRDGVYAGKASFKGKDFATVVSIGLRPSVDSDPKKTIEAHLLNFSQEIYGEELRISLYKFLRPIEKFSTIELLIKAIENDILETSAYFIR